MNTRARLCVELGPVKARWEAWCALHGVTMGEGIRQLVLDVLDTNGGMPDARGAPGPGEVSADGHRERIEIRLTAEEFEGVRRHATAGGLTANRWIVALVRAQLMREPQLGAHEMRMLADSNQHLAMIVTLLGRLQGRTDVREVERVLAGVRVVIDAHLRTVAQVLRANLDRWSR
ncbi:plasmid stabilization protein [Burkholderia sp. WAC0059]|uniref:plasmid stabilization protein n=1 Tax=Burkholderia sp. WAC0059 TaxID=2066022 RepID=UPI000C7E9272|nr:plasmid stabilization protein [Burkholderia sp. WAC0059]PLZ01764.1 plasmid stabilization protein [Burkholderia sp. WAC0059]